MLLPEKFYVSFLQVASGKQQPFAGGSLRRNAFRALALLTGTRNPVYVGYYYTKNSVKISSRGAFSIRKHKHGKGLKPVAAEQVPETLEMEISVVEKTQVARSGDFN